jgi:hypothetical protein
MINLLDIRLQSFRFQNEEFLKQLTNSVIIIII